MAIAEATKTNLQDFEGGQIAFSKDGKLLDRESTTRLSEFLWTTVDDAFQYSNKHKDTIPPDRSLFDFFLEKIEVAGFSPAEKEACIESCRLWGAYVGDPIERQSLKFFCLEECVDECKLSPILFKRLPSKFRALQPMSLWPLRTRGYWIMFLNQPASMATSALTSLLSRLNRLPGRTQVNGTRSP